MPHKVYESCYSLVKPYKFDDVKQILSSEESAKILSLSHKDCQTNQFKKLFSGQFLIPKTNTYSCCYGGHQFGLWAEQLGDGRVTNLFEFENENSQLWTVQLKGSGPTPYSRNADGFATLESSIREFLCSEALFHLNIPTTRSLCVYSTNKSILRDAFYNGNIQEEKSAILCRIAPSFIRFGNFELFAFRKDLRTLKKLIDYTIKYHFPHILDKSEIKYVKWFNDICKKTADLIIQWMRVGFVHGVMNTDNMSVLGLTIDCGPYGFMEVYDDDWTANMSDSRFHRYSFKNQVMAGYWNLSKLAESISTIIENHKELHFCLNNYLKRYEEESVEMISRKLGIVKASKKNVKNISDSLKQVFKSIKIDMSIFFRKLSSLDVSLTNLNENEINDKTLIKPLLDSIYGDQRLTNEKMKILGDWIRNYLFVSHNCNTSIRERLEQMNLVNPKQVLRNYLIKEAADSVRKGDFSLLEKIFDAIKDPYNEFKEEMTPKPPEKMLTKPGFSILSCSS